MGEHKKIESLGKLWVLGRRQKIYFFRKKNILRQHSGPFTQTWIFWLFRLFENLQETGSWIRWAARDNQENARDNAKEQQTLKVNVLKQPKTHPTWQQINNNRNQGKQVN